jgi:hypothetical protein
MNLTKTLTIGAAALGWLALAGQANAAASGSSSKEAKYAAATRYESGAQPSQKRSSYHPAATGRSASAPRGREASCASKGGRLIQERGGEWRCLMKGGRTVYAPQRKEHYATKSGRAISAPRGRETYQERGMKGGRSVQAPKGGSIGTHGLAPYSDIPRKSMNKSGRSGSQPQGSQQSH